MKTSGMYISGKIVRIVTLKGTKENHERIANDFHKFDIDDTTSSNEMKLFVDALSSYLQENEIEKIGINARPASGRFSGSADTSRIEGAIVATSNINVEFIFSQTITANNKKYGMLKTVRPTTNALGRAYDLAFEVLIND